MMMMKRRRRRRSRSRKMKKEKKCVDYKQNKHVSFDFSQIFPNELGLTLRCHVTE